MRFGKKLRKIRESLGLSQEAFADKCGLDRTYVGGVERGERNISLKNIDVIAKSIGMPVSKMMDGV